MYKIETEKVLSRLKMGLLHKNVTIIPLEKMFLSPGGLSFLKTSSFLFKYSHPQISCTV